MDKPEDINYLKQFVTKHPDNKMGWYLLGKHYLESGKEAKANYCFIQAGDIYEAFEQEVHPLADSGLEGLKEWEKRQIKRKLLRKVAILAVPLLLAALALPLNGYLQKKYSAPTAATDTNQGVGVVIVPGKEAEPIGYAMGKIMAAGGEGPGRVMAVKLEEENGWLQWNSQATLLMNALLNGEGSELNATMLDAAACLCEPGDPGDSRSLLAEWRNEQEMHWTLASAIQQYKEINGKWPQRLDDLVRPYPDNLLAGEGAGMADAFPLVLRKLKEKAVSKTAETAAAKGGKDEAGSNQSAPDGDAALIGSNGLFDEDWSKPLEIAVDVSKHQLAVVQGSAIVRSYPVGLGGDRTPEGTFRISEKVRNPNGRDDGIFGSRGMTLSDTLYAIHGTDEPDSIGKDESLGCIRMRKSDVEELYDMVPLGTKVTIKSGILPSNLAPSAERFRLQPKANETNPAKEYQWLT
ncbi:L,D-transpeptidase [Paenibacillus soyae]|uniref:L,D-transpeptidase n=1 Tax=Paenibacillus soyae TaxID=2969249 RepID=A0A9X2MNB2_9BACL|nr:L,D-transpeptidase [Paenibacillus soyae]MCR2803234.1 L,D-transpeptidase [Paenibacillus soyae]